MYLVIIEDIVMTLHCGLLLNNVDIWLTEYTCGHSLIGYIMLFVTSYLLRFCWIYRAVLTHSFLIYSCIVYQREIGFGILATPLRWIFLIVGIILICLMIKKVYESKDNCRNLLNRSRS